MPTLVLVIWTLLLVAVVALLPFIVVGLHRAWRAARSIDRYFGEMLEAAVGIAGNTQEIARLDDTIATAGKMLASGGAIHQKAATLGGALAERAKGVSS